VYYLALRGSPYQQGMGDDRQGVLLTGATGFLGGEVLARLLECEEGPVYTLIRAEDDERAAARLRRVVASLMGSDEACERAIAVAGDITQPRLGMSHRRRDWLAERVDRVIHSAASVSFTLGLDESRAINVDGTRRVLAMARYCATRGELRSFVHVSTAYVAGTRPGPFGEHELEVGQGFRNAYEQSKFEAELLLRERGRGLPVQVVRPSIVVGDSRSGWTPAFNVLYSPLRAFSSGAYPLSPARRSAPVDIVPVDYVADAILALEGRPGTTHHLVAGRRASTVGEIVELASTNAGRRAPRLLRPRVYRSLIHPVLVRTGPEKRRRALRRSEIFFPYFAMDVSYDDERARAALAPAGLEPPPLRAYFDRLMDFARLAEWGRRPYERHETFVAPDSREAPLAERIERRRRFLRASAAGQR
jgi:thioester reductase-like protein